MRVIVCFAAPRAVVAEHRGNSDERQPSFAAPRSSSADDGGRRAGNGDTDCHSSTRAAYPSSVVGVNSSIANVDRHSSARWAGRRCHSPLLISVLPPTQRPSAYAIGGVPSVAHVPWWRYFSTISSS